MKSKHCQYKDDYCAGSWLGRSCAECGNRIEYDAATRKITRDHKPTCRWKAVVDERHNRWDELK